MKKCICLFLIFSFVALNTLPLFAAETVTESNADVKIKVGEKYTLEAVIKYFTDNQVPISVPVKWETTDSKVATVSNGVITGVCRGGAVITATAINNGNTYKAKAKVYVSSSVTGVTLNKSSITLKVGQSDSLVENVLPDSAVLKKVTWSSEDSSVASVSGGTVKGIKDGYTNISATTVDGGFIARCAVRVVSTVTGVTIAEHDITKKVGQEYSLTYTVWPSDAFLKDVTWASSNSKIVSVSNGKIKALTIGMANITVTTIDGKHSDSCHIEVEGLAEGLNLNKDSLQLAKGGQEALVATVYPDTVLDKTVIWSSNDNKVATVKDGLVTGVGEGETEIVATSKDGNFTKKATVKVISYDVELEKIDLMDSEVSMKVGENKWFLYKALPENAVIPKLAVKCELYNETRSIPISIKNNQVYLEAKVAGNYILTLYVADNPDIYDTCKVYIKTTVTGMEISDSNLELYVGQKYQLKGNALPDTAIIKGVTWKSSNTKIATVNSDTGVVLGVADGKCIITATTIDGGLTRECEVKVKNPVNIEDLKIKDSDGNILGESPQVGASTSNGDSIKITIDGIPVTTDQPPILYDDRVLAPLRAIFEGLGAAVYWNEDLQTATGVLGNKTVQLTINNPKAYVNGEVKMLDVPAKMVNDRTMVPVRFIAESLGVKVDWNEKTNTVVITTN